MEFFKLCYIVLPFVNCNENEIKRKTFTNFRKQVEEVSSETTPFEDDTSNIVSFLVKNVKKIFGSQNEPTVLIDSNPKIYSTISNLHFLEPKRSTIASETTLEIINENAITNILIQDFTLNNELHNLSRDLAAISKVEDKKREINALIFIDSSPATAHQEPYNITSKKSCIFCNNIDIENCNDPKNKLMPSVTCELDEDLCYSQHTPFGLVDRGCYNINRNVTMYVCSCNLCNYIAISEMPYIFSTKRDWTENVIEMSRTKRFRRSIFKDMSCLRCEANKTIKSKDISDGVNCLEGNIGSLPIQECGDDEICGVRAVRSKGYLWRGCVSQPLYNYWWSLCDTDLCNYDALVSIYDT